MPDDAIEAYDRALDQMDAGEDRPGQRQMVRAVAQAFDKGNHLMVEAGTGTGKSLAYLIPALTSEGQTIVATATKALQGQLVEKDLPIAAAAIDREVTWELVKGRSNYICLVKIDELGEILEPELEEVVEWASITKTGDISEVDFELPPRVSALVTARSEECPGAAACREGADCFSEAARRRADDADVVVVNHHLLLADLKIRALGGALLPGAHQVVIDEAHRFEDAAVGSFGVDLYAGRVRYAARLARGLIAETRVPDEIETEAGLIFDSLPRGRATAVEGALRNEVNSALTPLTVKLARLRSEMAGIPEEGALREKRMRLQRVLASLQDDVARIITPAPGEVTWVEGSESGPRIRLAPLDVSPLIRESILESSTAVFTSATLTGVGGFERTARALGLSRPVFDAGDEKPLHHDELDVSSPFDFAANSLLYCATHLPDPRAESFLEASQNELAKLIEASGGGALCLFTSWRAMIDAHEALGPDLEYPVMRQGEAPPERLIERFIAETPAVLFATQTFWQGIDVPGEPLRLVVIDKIPFSPPDDPLLKARARELQKVGGDAFREDALPRAALSLKQGIGRLIRSMSDWGVAAVLDRRLAKTGYGKELVACLPPMRRTTTFGDVAEFFAERRGT